MSQKNSLKETPSTQELSLHLRKQIGGFWLSQMIYVAAKLRLADLIKTAPLHYNEIADSSQTKPDLIYRVLRGLASQGIFFEKPKGVFQNTKLSKLLLSDRCDSLKDLAIFYGEEPFLMFEFFLENLKTGTPAFELKYGKPHFNWLEEHSPQSKIFNNAMRNLSVAQADAILASFDFSNIKNLVDIGGGNGYLLGKILQNYPQISGTLFDQAHLQDEAKNQIQNQSVGDRCQFVSGDFFKNIPGPTEAYIMKYILHDWDDDKAQTILENCIKASGKNTRILVVEQMITSGNDESFAKLSDCNMMGLLGSRERTLEEWQELFHKVGLRIEEIVDTNYLLFVFDLRCQSKRFFKS